MMDKTKEAAEAIKLWMEAFFHRSMHGWIRYVKAIGLSMPQFSILMALYHGGRRGVHEIGERMDITSAAASQLIDRLVQAGLVERSEDPEDRRARRIALSAKGRESIESGIRERYRWVDELVTHLSAEELKAVENALPALMEVEKKLSHSNHAPCDAAGNKDAATTTFSQEE